MITIGAKTEGEGEEKSEAVRIFFGVGVPRALENAIAKLIESFDIPATQARWVRPAGLHITLRFLGETEKEKVAAVIEAGRKVFSKFRPIKIAVEGMGLFPNHEQPRVVWLGITGDIEVFAKMAAEISEEMDKLGFEPEALPFMAHLTIGRVRSNAVRGKLVRVTRQYHRTFFGAAEIDRVNLYESKLNPGGSIYTVIESFQLVGS